MILGENLGLGLGCVVQNRFYDTVKKRDGLWKIVFRQAIYDMSTFTFPKGFVEIDQDALAKYPAEYAALVFPKYHRPIGARRDPSSSHY